MPTEPSPHWLEMANWAAGVLVAIFGAFSLRQLTILKTDIHLRNQRAAMEKALEGAKLWAEALEGFRPFLANCKAANLSPTYSGEMTDFLFASLLPDQQALADAKEKIEGWAKPINAIDAIAAMYMTGVADEETGFNIFGRDYCECIGAVYDVICANRKNPIQPRYDNTVQLFKLWTARLRSIQVETEIRAKQDELTGIKVTPVKPLGSAADA